MCPLNQLFLIGFFSTLCDIKAISEPEWVVAALDSLLSRVSRVRLCDPIDGSPPGSPVAEILSVRTLEWAAISFSVGFTSPLLVTDFDLLVSLTSPAKLQC